MNTAPSLQYPVISSRPTDCPRSNGLPPQGRTEASRRWWAMWMQTLIAEILQLTACEVR